MGTERTDFFQQLKAAVEQREGVPRGSEIVFRCPNPEHDDEHPSASYNTVAHIFHCHACGKGGGSIQLAKLLNVELPPGIPGRKGDLVLTGLWEYRGPDGTLLGYAARYDGKKKIVLPFFEQDAAGRWQNKAPAAPTPLFGLDKLAAQPDAPVLIIEGEKCASLIQNLGGVAITSQGGSGAAAKADWTPLAGRRVVIWSDNDGPGAKYGKTVAKKLASLSPPASVSFIDVAKLALPPKGDCADWLAAHKGATLNDVLALPRVGVPGDPDVEDSEFAAVFKKIRSMPTAWIDPSIEPPPRRFLLTRDGQGYISRGIVAIIAAAGGVGKTFVAVQAGVAISCGRPLFGVLDVVEHGRVALLLAEEDEDEVHRRVRAAAFGVGLAFAEAEHRELLIRNLFPVDLLGHPNIALAAEQGAITTFAEELLPRLAREGEWATIIFDSVVRFGGPDVEKDNAAACAFLQTCEQFTKLPGNPTVILVSHVAKAAWGAGSAASSPRGSSALRDNARWAASLTVDDKDPTAVELTVTKSNYTAPGQAAPIPLVRDAGGCFAHDAGRCSSTKNGKRRGTNLPALILACLGREGPCTVNRLRMALGRSNTDIKPALARLLQDGQIGVNRDGPYPRYQLVDPEPGAEP